MAKLGQAKQQLQQLFNSGEFTNAINVGLSALQLCEDFPTPIRLVESIQFHLNISNAYIQTNNNKDAEHHANKGVELAEAYMLIKADNPVNANKYFAEDLLSTAINNKAMWSLKVDRLDEADELCNKAIDIVSSTCKANDPKLLKPLRTSGMIKQKRGQINDAAALMNRCYDILFDSYGPKHPELIITLGDLIEIECKRGKLQLAIDACKRHEDALKKEFDASHIVFGDCKARLASCYELCGKLTEAIALYQDALDIRQKKLTNPGEPNYNLLGITLIKLASLKAESGDIGPDTEALLNRAIESLMKSQNRDSEQHIMKAKYFLNKIIKSRNPGNDDDDDDDNDNDNNSPSSSPKNKSPTRITYKSPSKLKSLKQMTSDLLSSIPEDEHAATRRMQIAGKLYQDHQFALAEIVVEQAYDIYTRDLGENHEHTKAALHNLEVIRNNGLLQLWHEIAEEEIKELALLVDEIKLNDFQWCLKKKKTRNRAVIRAVIRAVSSIVNISC